MRGRKSEAGGDPKERGAISSEGKIVSTVGLGSRMRDLKLLSLAQVNIQKTTHILRGQFNEFIHKEHTRVIITKIKK